MRKWLKPLVIATTIGLTATGAAGPCLSQDFTVTAISSRADAVSGGDVLVRLTAPSQSRWTAQLGGRDVTSSFRDRLALLTDLALGPNVLTIRAGGRVRATLDLLNHPQTGPIFSGPHQAPFVCQTAANGLGPPLDSRGLVRVEDLPTGIRSGSWCR